MGLYKDKVQNICTGSYILPSADDKRSISVSREMVRTKKGREEKKLSIKKHSVPRLGLGGLSHEKRREEPLKRENHVGKYHKTKYMEQVCLSF
jgi:hypothetical protein